MEKKRTSIPVRTFDKIYGNGIAVAKIGPEALKLDQEFSQAHRHEYHFFVLQKSGVSHTEIDFEKYLIDKPAIFYQSPKQVHRTLKLERMSGYVLTISNENISADYLKLLQSITPVKPLTLSSKEDLMVTQQSFALCTDLFERKWDRLYHSQLRDSCNALIALFISHYVKQSKPTQKFSRFQMVEKDFSGLLEQHFAALKRPAEYAEILNISVAYLNECVKKVSGYSVSHHIQQRVVLEAKRLLYHSDKSVKEIASELGYDDYAYFSRLFAKVTGMTALTFRSKTTAH